jgi:putative ABC transport system permease protein
MASQGTYSTMDMSSLLDGVSKILSTLTLFISGIAGISLFIAGVGVMNMMYTSVSERTQEIGVRRAVGAKRGDIRKQFMAEGLLLTISSGIIGYIIGFLIALIISQFLPFKVSPTLSTVAVAVGTTVILGLVFSIAPANSAARKDLVEILR